LVPAELEKIGKDFSATYRLRNLTLYFQNPDKIRLEASSRVLGDALLILNGTERFYTLSKLNIRKRENLDKEPAKRQSLLEYTGLLSAGTFDFMAGAFVESTMLNGSPMRVYDLRYKGEAKSFYRIWVNPQTRLVAKRVWMESDSKPKATFLYINPTEVAPGVWLPSQCEIQNGEGILSAVIDFRETTINKGLDAALFEIKP
jgi:outer membrane lipoprotein-sorting protein